MSTMLFQLTGTSASKYEIFTDGNILGRQYDNISEAIDIEIPKTELGKTCTIYFFQGNRIVDFMLYEGEPLMIHDNVSQYEWIDVIIRFTNTSGYVKQSEIKRFEFLHALKPQTFEPFVPDWKPRFLELYNEAIVSVEKTENAIQFFNSNGQLIDTISTSCVIVNNQPEDASTIKALLFTVALLPTYDYGYAIVPFDSTIDYTDMTVAIPIARARQQTSYFAIASLIWSYTDGRRDIKNTISKGSSFYVDADGWSILDSSSITSATVQFILN